MSLQLCFRTKSFVLTGGTVVPAQGIKLMHLKSSNMVFKETGRQPVASLVSATAIPRQLISLIPQGGPVALHLFCRSPYQVFGEVSFHFKLFTLSQGEKQQEKLKTACSIFLLQTLAFAGKQPMVKNPVVQQAGPASALRISLLVLRLRMS